MGRASRGEEKAVGSLFIYFSSINSTILDSLLLGGYSTSASYDALFLIRRDNLLEAHFHHFLARPTFGQQRDPLRGHDDLLIFWLRSGRRFFKDNAFPSLRPSGPTFKENDVRLRAQWRWISFFLDHHAPYATLTTPCLCFAPPWLHLDCYAYTSTGGLRDMGTHGSPSTRVPEVFTKWTRPVRSPTDLLVGP
jgi:hypothetical protein